MAAVIAAAGGILLNSAALFLIGSTILVPLAMFWRPTTPRGDQDVISNSTHPSVFSETTAPDGRLALLLALYIVSLAPLSLLVIGETFEHALPGNFFSASHSDTQLKEWMGKLDKRYAAPVAILERVLERLEKSPPGATFISAMLLNEKRRLDLEEQILLAKPTTPEVRALIRANEGQKARTQIEPINLKGRSLQYALLESTSLIGADLRGAQLQGADLSGAQLQGTNLRDAQLQGANLN